MIGQTLSHFRITAKLGEGGMGEVYRAEDTKLGREVAIKVLPAAFTENPERLARFEREAHVLASLNHTNIAGIYEIGEDDGVRFLAMELAEGEDLATRLDRGAIPLDEALPIALQVAAALEAAHDRGIVHRDLKPANVMVASHGAVKVLDFGLAKALEQRAPTDGNITTSPTLTAQMTQAGVILGTAGYMSPEQARGKPVDKRADIWAFGCLLFELLSAQPAFPGETASEVLAKVLEREPDWGTLPATAPPGLVRLARRCLRKDSGQRLRDIGDARIEIEEARSDDGDEPVALQATASTAVISRRGFLIGAIAVAAIAAATAVWWLLPEERVVYLIDTAAPLGVYDSETLSSGRMNADDLSDVLGDLPVTLVKEATSPLWRREHQILMQRPTLILIHLSAFAYPPSTNEFDELTAARAEVKRVGLEDPVDLGRARLIAFLGYIALGNPGTRFVVYSRGRFEDAAERARWISEAETRFPQLEDKIVAYDVPGRPGTATFRDPDTGEEVKRLVKSILGLE